MSLCALRNGATRSLVIPVVNQEELAENDRNHAVSGKQVHK